MDQDKLWHTFTHSGRVEDYLRYRGVELTQRATNSTQEEVPHGGPQTAFNDRRSDSAGV